MVPKILRTPNALSNMGSQGVQNLIIHWEKIIRGPCGNLGSSKTPPNTPYGSAPSILCNLTHFHAFFALQGFPKRPQNSYFRTLEGLKMAQMFPKSPSSPKYIFPKQRSTLKRDTHSIEIREHQLEFSENFQTASDLCV